MNETTFTGRGAVRSIAVGLGGGGLAEPQIALHAWNANLIEEVRKEACVLAAAVSGKMGPDDPWSVQVLTTGDQVTRVYIELDPEDEGAIDRAMDLLRSVALEY